MSELELTLSRIRCRVATPLRVERRRDRGGLGPKSKREKKTVLHRTDYAENRWLHRDTALPTQRLQKYADTDRCNNEYVYVCNKYEQITKQGLQPAMGHG